MVNAGKKVLGEIPDADEVGNALANLVDETATNARNAVGLVETPLSDLIKQLDTILAVLKEKKEKRRRKQKNMT